MRAWRFTIRSSLHLLFSDISAGCCIDSKVELASYTEPLLDSRQTRQYSLVRFCLVI
jgi:hypothetical protein